MEVIVLVKPVPATDARLQVAAGGRAIRTGRAPWVLDPGDEIALEAGLRIREAHGGRVSAVGAGPPESGEVLRTALALGADRAILVEDDGIASRDPVSVARVLAGLPAVQNRDLVLAGRRSVAGQSGLTGPALAELLGIAIVPAVVTLSVDPSARRVRCRQAATAGRVELEAPLPALLTVERGLNEPRSLSIRGIRAARKKSLHRIPAGPGDPGRARIVEMRPPDRRRRREILAGGTASARAAELVRRLRESTGGI